LTNTVSGVSQTCILTGFAYGVLVQGNTTHHCGTTQGHHGIYVSNSARGVDLPVIRGNTVYSNAGTGIQLNGDCFTKDHNEQSDGLISGALIEQNLIHDDVTGAIALISTSDSIVRSNVTYGVVGPGSV